MNFETVTVNGLAVANVPGRVYVLACNPNDNSVSLIDTTTNTVAQRVPVGLGPVAVTWNPSNNRFYTANLIGDSVTAVEVTRPNGVLQVRLIGTGQVLDEPMDVAIGADGRVYVAQGGRSALARVDAATLALVDAFFLTDDFTAVDLLANPAMSIPGLSNTGGPPRALRMPRRLVMDGTLVHVLALKGDTGFDMDVPVGTPANPGFKYSMLTWDTAIQSASAAVHWSTFGSANEAMVRGVDDKLYVVGGLARNDVRGNAMLAGLPRGFVESHVWTVPSGLSPSSHVDRDLNDDGLGNTVAASLSAAMPAGIALLSSGNNVRKVFVSSFGTDRIIELNLTGATLPTAARTVIPVPAPAPNALGLLMSGPRDLEIAATTSGARLYCLNDLDCSVSVFDPNVTGSAELARISLANRLTASQQVGRRFLYDARISGSGKVSCASCHIDGKTDSLAWHLGTTVQGTNPDGAPMPYFLDGLTGVIVSWLNDGVTTPLRPGTPAGSHVFPLDKGLMVTQSLQGLVDHPVNEESQYLFSGAPYHWRGDRATFDAFNEAFVNLLGAPPLTAGTGADAKGLTDADMRLYRLYVESIMYPPNPEQQKDRKLSGQKTGILNNFGATDGTLGMVLFLGKRLDDAGDPGRDFSGRSCVHCHTLPSGSNSRITITDPFGGAGPQPLESAQLRGLVQREGLLDLTHVGIGATPRLGESGLVHSGESVGTNPPVTINSFITELLGPLFVGVPAEASALVRFVRELDWGIAPMIGSVRTFPTTSPTAQVTLAEMEGQALLAHCDVVARLRRGTVLRGYYLDVVASPGAVRNYREEATGGLVSTTTLIANGSQPDSCVVFEAVPVGSGRRIASNTGNGTWAAVGGAAPAAPTLVAMRPGVPWRDVASITLNWNVGVGQMGFEWSPPDTNPVPTPIHPAAVRVLQQAVTGMFGVTPGHHEPPRRFRVTGTDIRPGARLRLAFSSSGGAGPAGTTFQTLELPIFPNRESGGTLIWETAAEATPIVTLGLLCGGPFAPDVARVFLGAVPETVPNALAPATWNSFHVRVVNADGTSSPFGVWQPLTVQNN